MGKIPANSRACSRLDGRDLLGGDADGAIQWDADAVQQRGEQVGLVALDAGEETSGLEGAAAFAGKDEG